MTGIVDTGFLVALAARRDCYHDWAKELSEEISSPLVTCEAVLAETAYHLQSSRIVLRMLEAGLFKIDFDLTTHQKEVRHLAEKYQDRQPDLADLCLVRMSELNPKLSVWTVDSDFLVYRRNGRQVIPVVMPPTTRK